MVDWVFYVTSAVLGLVIGSYLNVVIVRGPANWGLVDASPQTPSGPRSVCPACGARIAPQDLIPIVSFLALKARCRNCGARISARYPVIEALCAAAFAFNAALYGPSVEWALASVFASVLIALAAIDIETTYLPDALTLPLLIGGIAVNTVDLFAPWPEALLGAALGYAAFEAIRRGYFVLRGREGLGQGDSKLIAAIGSWVGASALPMVVFAASIATIIVIAARGRLSETSAEIPFGPGLCAAGAAALWLSALSVSVL